MITCIVKSELGVQTTYPKSVTEAVETALLMTGAKSLDTAIQGKNVELRESSSGYILTVKGMGSKVIITEDCGVPEYIKDALAKAA